MPMYRPENVRISFPGIEIKASAKNPQAEIYAHGWAFCSGHQDFIPSDFGGRRFMVIKHRGELVSQDRFRSFGSIAQEWFTDDETPVDYGAPVYRGPVPALWSSACYPLGVPEARDYNAMTWVEEAPTINSEPWESAVRRYCEHDVRLTAPVKHPRGGF